MVVFSPDMNLQSGFACRMNGRVSGAATGCAVFLGVRRQDVCCFVGDVVLNEHIRSVVGIDGVECHDHGMRLQSPSPC